MASDVSGAAGKKHEKQSWAGGATLGQRRGLNSTKARHATKYGTRNRRAAVDKFTSLSATMGGGGEKAKQRRTES